MIVKVKKNKIIDYTLILLMFFFFAVSWFPAFSEEEGQAVMNMVINAVINETVVASEVKDVDSLKGKTSKDLVSLAWEASYKNDKERLDAIVAESIALYGAEANDQASEMTVFPERGSEKEYQSINDVATCLFVQAESLMNTGKTKEAIDAFENVIKSYPFARAWDPRGWYWSVKEKSQASIDVLTGKAQLEMEKKLEKIIRTQPSIHTKGKANIIDYTKYGKFTNVGKAGYKYVIKDMKGLSDAVGEGIYPNTSAIYSNPRYKQVRKEGRLKGSHWDFVNKDDLEAAYFKWVTAPEPLGIRLFYLGMIFEKAGMYYEALKSYHALVVHFPKTIGYTYYQTPWYPGQAAIAKIRHIIRMHPELHLVDKWMKIEVENGYDNIVENDTIVTFPGKIEKQNLIDQIKGKLPWGGRVDLGKVVKTVGKGEVQLVQYANSHWQMMVKGKPYVIRGITYAPTKVGQSPDKGTLKNWMEEDTNNNGQPDGPYDSWVDENGNNIQDANEKVVGDFQLMKDMGVNTIRLYHHPDVPNKAVLRKMYQQYGFRVIMGDFVGKYTIGSGATWAEGTDYENEEHLKNMKASVKKMVMEYKDEPYILLWLLGNENNYGVASNADKKPEVFYKFIDELAVMIKSIDPNHPVGMNNGDTLYLDKFAANSPNVDIISANVYRGDYGFGSFWEQVAGATGKPAFIAEYGCPAYAGHMTLEGAEKAQADYHKGNWMDIEENLAGYKRGMGNSIGGVAFEWMDEWWKNYEPYMHDRISAAVGPFPGNYYFEEWFGLVGQGNGQNSPFMRHLRDSYHFYKSRWNPDSNSK